jgi:plasmid stability protein
MFFGMARVSWAEGSSLRAGSVHDIGFSSLISFRHMPAVTIRKLSPETHRSLKARARGHGRSTEAEIRAILDAAVKPADEIGIGSALAKLGRRFRGIELDIRRDPTPARAMRFE